MNLTFQLPRFEGPLALLLHFIRKEEMDIFDIPIQKITAQYLEYLKMMRELDLEVAGEFISMAATLLHIKSRMLLPQYNEDGELVENEDPRKELVQRLLEYERFQSAAKELYERPLLGRDYWTRGFQEVWEEPEEELIVEDNGLFQLIQHFRRAMALAKKKVHQVAGKIQSISSRIQEISQILAVGVRKSLQELITAEGEGKSRQVLITFLTVLELAKLGFVRLFQTDHVSDLWIETRKELTGDALSKVEEYSALPEALENKFELPQMPQTTQMAELELSGVDGSSISPEIAEARSAEPETSELEKAAPDTGLSTGLITGDESQVQVDLSDPGYRPGDATAIAEEIATDEEIEQAEAELFQKEKQGEAFT